MPPLDSLVAALQNDRRVFGARLTGAGFGGACVALVEAGAQGSVASDALAAYAALGFHGSRLV